MHYLITASQRAASDLCQFLAHQHQFNLSLEHALELTGSVLEIRCPFTSRPTALLLIDPKFPDSFAPLDAKNHWDKVSDKIIEITQFYRTEKYLAPLRALADEISDEIVRSLKPPCEICRRADQKTTAHLTAEGNKTVWACQECQECQREINFHSKKAGT